MHHKNEKNKYCEFGVSAGTTVISRAVVSITMNLFSGPEWSRLNEESFHDHEDINVEEDSYRHHCCLEFFAMEGQTRE